MSEAPPPKSAASLLERLTQALRLLPATGVIGGQPKSFSAALIVLAFIPPITAFLALLLGFVAHEHGVSIERNAAPHLAQRKAALELIAIRAQSAPFFKHPTISDLVERIARVIPTDARLQMVSVDKDGAVKIEVDCHDPDVLLAANRGDNLLKSLSMIAQQPADEGVRVTLVSRKS